MMMAHPNNYNSNPFDGNMYEAFDRVQQEGKLDCSTTNLMNDGRAMTAPIQMQPGFQQQQQQQQQSFNNLGLGGYNNNGNNNNGRLPGNRAVSSASMEVQPTMMNFQQNNMGIGMSMSQQVPLVGYDNNMGINNNIEMNNNNNYMNMGMNMNNFMNQGMMANNMQFQPSASLMNGSNAHLFGVPFSPANRPPQQQLSCGVPTYVTASNDCPAPPTTNCNPTSSSLDSLKSFKPDSFSQKEHVASSFSKKSGLNKDTERRVSLVQSALVKRGSSSSSMFSSTVSKTKELLPVEYEPTSTAVICGNKRKYFESKGNKRFREVCKMFIPEYTASPTKIEKSAVVSKVMNILLEDCTDGICFVSPQGGRWYAVSERTAREKIGTYLRDCLSGHYLSSAKNKIARRKKVGNKNSSSGAPTQSKQTGDAIATPAPSSFAAVADTDQDDGSSLGDSVSFYDVDDLTPVPM
jgi:hypothetical protein